MRRSCIRPERAWRLSTRFVKESDCQVEKAGSFESDCETPSDLVVPLAAEPTDCNGTDQLIVSIDRYIMSWTCMLTLAAIAVFALALPASASPARRGAAVDPIGALRGE